MAVTVYRFGLPSWVELPNVVDEQLRLVHDLREDLVTVQHGYEQTLRDIWSSYPAVAQAEAEAAAAEEEAAAAAAAVKEQRSKQRTRAPKGPAAQELREARARVRQARQARRDAIAAVAGDADRRVRAAGSDRDAAVKALYRAYSDRGLYWACHNDVVDHHRVAVRRVAAKRRQGRPAAMRHHRWDGSGALAVQLQRGAGMPPRTPQLLASGGGPWRNVLRLSPWRPGEDRPGGADRHGTLAMRVGSQIVQLPVVMHEWMDPDADVTGARLVVRRVAGGRRCHLCVTAKLPDPKPVTAGPVVAVHCGWRREDDDAVRVATWRASEPVTVPERLRDVVRATGRTTGVVVLPAAWRRRIAYYDRVQAERDRQLEPVREQLLAWLAEHPQPEDTGPDPARVRAWRSQRHFALLAWAWHYATPPGGADIAARLMSWRAWDRRLWEEMEHGRRKALGRRDDAWRRVAAWLADTAAAVVVDDTDLAGLIRRVTAAETAVPGEVTAVAARQRFDASPGGLRERIVSTSRRDGVAVVEVPAAGLSAGCYRCGHENEAAEGHERICGGCGHRYDVDDSAVLHMLRRASAHLDDQPAGAARDTA